MKDELALLSFIIALVGLRIHANKVPRSIHLTVRTIVAIAVTTRDRVVGCVLAAAWALAAVSWVSPASWADAPLRSLYLTAFYTAFGVVAAFMATRPPEAEPFLSTQA